MEIIWCIIRSEKQYELRSTLSSDHLILLIDPRLAHLPLESLEIFKHVQIGGISRDFSIQSLYNRLNTNIGIDETTATTDDSKGVWLFWIIFRFISSRQ